MISLSPDERASAAERSCVHRGGERPAGRIKGSSDHALDGQLFDLGQDVAPEHSLV